MVRTSIVVFALSALVLASACGGGSKASSTGPASAESGAPAAQPKAAASADASDNTPASDAPAADQPPPPPAKSEGPSGEQILAFVQTLADIIEANAGDCDAMGDKMNAHLDTDPALIKYMNSMTGTPTHKQWLADNKDAFAKITQKMMGIGKCMNNAKVKTAMGKFN